MFSIIVAHTENYGIGNLGQLPWPKIPSDMKHFQKMTKGNRIIMGRKTWESIGRALPDRENIVLTRDLELSSDPPNGIQFYRGIQNAIETGWSANKETFVIGGTQIYEECFKDPSLYNNMQTIHRTIVKRNYPCDCIFPFEPEKHPNDWQKTEEHFIAGENLDIPDIVIQTYTRVNHEENAYLSLLQKIVHNGILSESRTGVNTLSTFGETLRFDVSDGTIPLLTTKRVPFRLSLEEMLFFISGSTDVQKLRDKNVHIWDGNTTREFLDQRGLQHYEEYDMGPTYSFLFRHAGAEGSYMGKNMDYKGCGTDQLQNVIDALKSDEPNRRIMINLWSAAHLDKMSLPPCLFNYIFKKDIIKKPDGTVEKHVSLMAIMRSADEFLGVPFNLSGATIILRMVCHLSGCLPKELCLVMADAHIYTNHIDQVKLQLTRKAFRFPRLVIKRSANSIKSIDHFVTSDFELIGYKSHKTITAPMAI